MIKLWTVRFMCNNRDEDREETDEEHAVTESEGMSNQIETASPIFVYYTHTHTRPHMCGLKAFIATHQQK